MRDLPPDSVTDGGPAVTRSTFACPSLVRSGFSRGSSLCRGRYRASGMDAAEKVGSVIAETMGCGSPHAAVAGRLRWSHYLGQ